MSSPVVRLCLDYQFPTDKFTVVVHSKDTPVIRCWFEVNEEKFQPTSDYTAYLAYTSGFETNTSPIVITGVISTNENRADFTLPDSIINGDYYAQIALYDVTNAKQYVFGDGKISIKRTMTGW
jgi:hypothetical protein